MLFYLLIMYLNIIKFIYILYQIISNFISYNISYNFIIKLCIYLYEIICYFIY